MPDGPKARTRPCLGANTSWRATARGDAWRISLASPIGPSAILASLRASITLGVLAASYFGCGSGENVVIVPPPEVDLVALFGLNDAARPIEVASLGVGSGLRDLSAPIIALPQSLVIGFSFDDLEHLRPPGADTLAVTALRPLSADEARDSLPSPRWLTEIGETGSPETLEPDSFSIRLSSDWVRPGRWTEVPTEPRIASTHSHAMAYDESRRAVIAVGTAGFLTESWQYDGRGWNSLGPVGTIFRRGHRLAYDPVRERVVMFGGLTTSSSISAETWELGPEGWAQKAPQRSPPARLDHAMAFDVNRGQIVLFGGNGPDAENPARRRLADTWTYDGETWTQLLGPAPEAREGHQMVYDEARGVVLMFGGAGPLAQDQTWILEAGGWRELEFDVRPPQRSKFGMVYDSVRGKTVLFGGWRGPVEYADLWELDAYGWREVPVFGPSPRCNHAMAYDAGRAQVVLTAGCDPSAPACGTLDDTWEFPAAD